MVIPLESLRQFRQAIYQTLWPSRDAAFEIIDAIAASRDARSAVEISLSPTMERNFASLYKAVERTRIDGQSLRPLLVRQAESTGSLLFDGWAHYALDHTPYPRPSAPPLSDRGYVHGANGAVIGHHYIGLGAGACKIGAQDAVVRRAGRSLQARWQTPIQSPDVAGLDRPCQYGLG